MYAIALTASTVYRWTRSNTIPLKDKHRILEHYSGPMRILHGEHDRNVPLSAARERHRLVPQIQTVAFDSNRFMIFQRPEMLAKLLKTFLGNSPLCMTNTAAEQPKTTRASAKSSP